MTPEERIKVERVLGRPVPDLDFARQKAIRILRNLGASKPPVNLEAIAEEAGVDLLFSSFGEDEKDISGFYRCKNQEIYVNSSERTSRQKFTVAHELGHHYLHRKLYQESPRLYRVLFRAPIAKRYSLDPLEKEANHFAAHLLVPKKMLDRYYDFADVSELATLFGVSAEMMRYRLRNEYEIDVE